jgi:hypothetical protein
MMDPGDKKASDPGSRIRNTAPKAGRRTRAPVLRIRIRDPVLFPPGSGIRIRDPDPGSGSGMNFFRIPDLDSGPFFDDIFLKYLQNPCYVIFITLAYSLNLLIKPLTA